MLILKATDGAEKGGHADGVEDLRSVALWELQEETISHMVAAHERCGNDVEFIPSKQWYIDVLTEKERFLKAADEIHWHPEHMKNRYKIWVENLKWDWCISRQRYFGVPFPVWYCKSVENQYLLKKVSCL